MEALLDRLEEVEAEAAERSQAEAELKSVNILLMQRLAEFQATNEDNVRQAEAQLLRMNSELQSLRRGRAEAEAALAGARTELRGLGVTARPEGRRAARAAVAGQADQRELGLRDGLLPSVRQRILQSYGVAWRRQRTASACGQQARAAAAGRLCRTVLHALRGWAALRRSERRRRTTAVVRRQAELLTRVVGAWRALLGSSAPHALLGRSARLGPAPRAGAEYGPTIPLLPWARSALRHWRGQAGRARRTVAFAAEAMRRGTSGLAVRRRRVAWGRWARLWEGRVVWRHLLGRAVAGQLIQAIAGWARHGGRMARARLLLLRGVSQGDRAATTLALRAWRGRARAARRLGRRQQVAAAHLLRSARRRCAAALRGWKQLAGTDGGASATGGGGGGGGALGGVGPRAAIVWRQWAGLSVRAGLRAFRRCARRGAARRAAGWWVARLGRRRGQQQLLRAVVRWRGKCVRVHARRRAQADAAREEGTALLAQARASSAALERENAQVQAHVGRATREISLLQRRMDERAGGAEAEAAQLRRQAAELQAHLEERTAQRQVLAQASVRASAELVSLREQLDEGRMKRTVEEQQERPPVHSSSPPPRPRPAALFRERTRAHPRAPSEESPSDARALLHTHTHPPSPPPSPAATSPSRPPTSQCIPTLTHPSFPPTPQCSPPPTGKASVA